MDSRVDEWKKELEENPFDTALAKTILAKTIMNEDALPAGKPFNFSGRDYFKGPSNRLYCLGPMLGKGAFGSVRYAVDGEGNEYAIKTIESKNGEDENMTDWRSAIVEEYNLNLKMGHCKENDWGWVGNANKAYMILKYGGQDLWRYLNAQTDMDISLKYELAYLLCEMVDDFHRKNKYCHRDIKLENILIRRHDGRLIVSLTDFGFTIDYDSSWDNRKYEIKGSFLHIPRVPLQSLAVKKDTSVSPEQVEVYALLRTLFMDGDLLEWKGGGYLAEKVKHRSEVKVNGALKSLTVKEFDVLKQCITGDGYPPHLSNLLNEYAAVYKRLRLTGYEIDVLKKALCNGDHKAIANKLISPPLPLPSVFNKKDMEDNKALTKLISTQYGCVPSVTPRHLRVVFFLLKNGFNADDERIPFLNSLSQEQLDELYKLSGNKTIADWVIEKKKTRKGELNLVAKEVQESAVTDNGSNQSTVLVTAIAFLATASYVEQSQAFATGLSKMWLKDQLLCDTLQMKADNSMPKHYAMAIRQHFNQYPRNHRLEIATQESLADCMVKIRCAAVEKSLVDGLELTAASQHTLRLFLYGKNSQEIKKIQENMEAVKQTLGLLKSNIICLDTKTKLPEEKVCSFANDLAVMIFCDKKLGEVKELKTDGTLPKHYQVAIQQHYRECQEKDQSKQPKRWQSASLLPCMAKIRCAAVERQLLDNIKPKVEGAGQHKLRLFLYSCTAQQVQFLQDDMIAATKRFEKLFSSSSKPAAWSRSPEMKAFLLNSPGQVLKDLFFKFDEHYCKDDGTLKRSDGKSLFYRKFKAKMRSEVNSKITLSTVKELFLKLGQKQSFNVFGKVDTTSMQIVADFLKENPGADLALLGCSLAEFTQDAVRSALLPASDEQGGGASPFTSYCQLKKVERSAFFDKKVVFAGPPVVNAPVVVGGA